MTGTNAELIEWGRMLGGREQELADALEAATLTATEDALYIKRMEAERDAALAVIAEVRIELEVRPEDTPLIPDVNEWADGYRVSNALEVIWAHRRAAK